jgi:Carboxypeptidase regulatory-like domain/TonB dependent receptor
MKTTFVDTPLARLFAKRTLFVILLAGMFLCLPLMAQVNQGKISGAVTDQSGGAIPGAMVNVTDVERGVTRSLTTDAAGTYSAPNLTPGNYTVHIEFKGFRPLDRKDIAIGVGQDVRIDATLQPGDQTQTVTVTGEPPAINTTNAQLGGAIEAAAITDLPISGRSFVYALSYRPGMQVRPGAGGGNVATTNGMRSEWNVYVFEGLADTNSYGTAGPLNIGFIAGGPDQSVILPVDTVQDFNLVENAKAEYGWRPGGQVNMGLKSGTNTMHGTAFALGRSTGMITRNPFFTAKPDTEFENYGATVGGAIKKDKLFYYAGFEGQLYNIGNPKTLIVPTTASLGGNKSNSLADAAADMLNNHGYTPTSMALGLNLAGCSASGVAGAYSVNCVPGKGVFSNGTNSTSLATAFPDIGGTQNGVAKIDYHLNDKNNFNVDFFRGIGNVTAPVANVTQPYWFTPLLGSVGIARAVWIMVPNSSFVNEVRTGWDYSLQKADPSPDCSADSGAPNYASIGFVSGAQVCGFPTTVISGFGTATLGEPNGISAKAENFRFADNLSYNMGKHNFKFGAEYARQIAVIQTAINASKGTLNFGTAGTAAFAGATPLQDFLAMVPQSESLQIGSLLRTLTYNQWAFYAQDDWRIVPRLTINLGLRYERSNAVHEANNQLANFAPGTVSGLMQDNGSGLYRTYPYNFAPRLGMAWDVMGTGRMVVRAGFGMFYNEYPSQMFVPNGAGTPGLQNMPTGFNLVGPSGTVTTPGGNINLGSITVSNPTAILPNVPIFGAYTGAGVTGSCTVGAPCKIAGVNPRIVTPQFFEWNLGIQRAITNTMTAEVTYVGNHGQHEFDLFDQNQPTPGAAGAAAENARRPFVGTYPWFSSIQVWQGFQFSNYNGLQATLNQRVTHGVNFTAGYTFSHAQEVGSADVNPVIPQNSLNPLAEYGNAGQDVRHRFTLQGRWALPGRKSPGQILQGWQLTGATQAWSAFAYNAVDGTNDVSGTGQLQDRWDLVGKASDFNGYGARNFIPCYGAAGSTFASAAGCSTGLPQACIDAANSVPTGPGGTTGLQQLTKFGCYMSGSSVIVPPAQGTFGTMGRNIFRGQGFKVVDISLMKGWTFKERYLAQFRLEIYNLLNTTAFAPLSATNGGSLAQPGKFGATTGTPNIINSSPIIGNGDTRRIQLGVRFQF